MNEIEQAIFDMLHYYDGAPDAESFEEQIKPGLQKILSIIKSEIMKRKITGKHYFSKTGYDIYECVTEKDLNKVFSDFGLEEGR